MGKFLSLISMFGLEFLFIASRLRPNSAVMWFASASAEINVIRIAVILILALVMMANISAHPILRTISGLIAIAILWWTVRSTLDNTIGLIDILSFALAGVSLLILSIEQKTKKAAAPPVKIPVRDANGGQLNLNPLFNLSSTHHHHLAGS